MSTVDFIGTLPAVLDTDSTVIKQLADELKVRIDNHLLVIPKGFRFDGASIPLPLTILWSRFDKRWVLAAAAHDYLYQFAGEVSVFRYPVENEMTFQIELSRRCCDRVFAELVRDGGSRTTTSLAFYAGVRSVGWYFWNRHKKRLRRLNP